MTEFQAVNQTSHKWSSPDVAIREGSQQYDHIRDAVMLGAISVIQTDITPLHDKWTLVISVLCLECH